MATLLSKIRAITGSTTGETSDPEVVGFGQLAIAFAITNIPKELLEFLGSFDTSITNGNGQAFLQDTILNVERNGIPCEEVPYQIAYQLSYSGSLYYATAFFPKYYITDGKVFIKPDPTSIAVGKVTSIRVPTIASGTDIDSASYTNIQGIIIHYTAGLDFEALSSYYAAQAASEISDISTDISTALTNFANELPTWSAQTMTALTLTNVTDALQKAEQLIDGTVTTNNAQDWIDDEDSEMVTSVIQTAQEEVQRAQAELAKEMQYQNEYSLDIQNEIARNKAAIDNALAYLQEAQTIIQSNAHVDRYNSLVMQYKEKAAQQFELAYKYVQSYIGNNSKTIALQAVTARQESRR